jgi:hypothetical protein
MNLGVLAAIAYSLLNMMRGIVGLHLKLEARPQLLLTALGTFTNPWGTAPTLR